MSLKKTKERLRRVRFLRQQVTRLIAIGDIDSIVAAIMDGYDYQDQYYEAASDSHNNLMLRYEAESRYYKLLSDHRNLLATIRNNPRLCNEADVNLLDNIYLPRSTVH